jgi:hypothetical protein
MPRCSVSSMLSRAQSLAVLKNTSPEVAARLGHGFIVGPPVSFSPRR